MEPRNGILMFASALFLMALPGKGCAVEDVLKGYKEAQVGDWITHEWKSLRGLSNTTTKVRQTITAKTSNSATVETVADMGLGDLPPQTQVLKFEEDKREEKKEEKKGHTFEDLGSGKETLKIKDRSYACTWKETRTTVESEERTTVTTMKIWTCPEVPLNGLVQYQLDEKVTVGKQVIDSKSTATVVDFGTKEGK